MNKKELFIDLASAFIKHIKHSLELNNILYKKGIVIANYDCPAFSRLEKIIKKYYGEDALDRLYDLAFDKKIDLYWRVNNQLEKYRTIINVEELYDYLFN